MQLNLINLIKKQKVKIEDTFETFDSRQYLQDYYSNVGSENYKLLHFLVNAYKDVPRKGKFLEFGGGPTIYPLIPAVKKTSEMHFSDYLPSNLNEVRYWLQNKKNQFNWKKFFTTTLRLEGKSKINGEILIRESLIRRKLKHLHFCDAYKKDPLGRDYRKYFDIIDVNFVAESIATSKSVWRQLVKNICSLLKDNGMIIMTAIQEARHYKVGNKNFPAVYVTVEDIKKILLELGFKKNSFMIDSVSSEILDEESEDYTGYKGLIFIKAQR